MASAKLEPSAMGKTMSTHAGKIEIIQPLRCAIADFAPPKR
jgi:hypothetical protein